MGGRVYISGNIEGPIDPLATTHIQSVDPADSSFDVNAGQ